MHPSCPRGRRKAPLVTPRADNLTFFSDVDLKSLYYPYTDALVLTLQISNCEVGCIFIDLGAWANIIYKGTLQRMGFLEFEIVSCSAVLSGYDGNMSIASRMIPLTVSTMIYNFLTEFAVMSMLVSL